MKPDSISLFGKHPAWGDHMPTQGVHSGQLAEFQQTMYNRGLTECLAQQRWGPVSEGGAQVPYAHWVLSAGPAQGAVLAYAAASSDAKARRQYPLVAALAGPDLKSIANMEAGCRFLRRLTRLAADADSESAVAEVFASTVAQAPSFSELTHDRRAFIKEGELADGSEGLAQSRIFHALSIHGAGYGNARVPLNGTDAPPLWLSLARFILEEEAGHMTLVWQAGTGFGDLFLTPPDARAFAYLFTPEDIRPPSATVAYRLAEAWQSTCLDNSLQWLTQSELLEPLPVAAPPPSKERRSWANAIAHLFRKNKSAP